MTKFELKTRFHDLNKQINEFLLDSARYTAGDRPDLALGAMELAESALKDAKYIAQCLVKGDSLYQVQYRPKGDIRGKWRNTTYRPSVYDVANKNLNYTRSLHYKTHEYRLTPAEN